MPVLTPSTIRRLQQLPQAPNSIWEGDRRPLSEGFPPNLSVSASKGGECILWVDGSQGIVRSMDVVPPEVGSEAIVRALLQAMEHPHNTSPSRPTKIVVRNRELQFFLRGVLQELDIKVECQTELPLIDEIFHSLDQSITPPPPPLPVELADLLKGRAATLWKDAPWDYLEDHQVIEVELSALNAGPLYASIMGNLGMEYGILLYRSYDSLQQFRYQVVNNRSPELLEQAFLNQDCLFMTYAAVDDDEEDIDLADLPFSEIEPNFGTIHPLEGLRPLTQEDEAHLLIVALEALHRFFEQHHRSLSKKFTARSGTYSITTPYKESETAPISVQVASRPDFADDLLDIDDDSEEPDLDPDTLGLQQVELLDDLVPDKAHLYLYTLPWSIVEMLQLGGQVYHPTEGEIPKQGDGLPVLIIKTSRPKAKVMIEKIEMAGGIKELCANPGLDPLSGEHYELEIARTGDGNLHLLGEFPEDDPRHTKARKTWDRASQLTGGYCGIVIAMGVTSPSPEIPFKHMLAFYEIQLLEPKDMGLGPMVRFPGADLGFGLSLF